jgi:diguanylate cyclase (GGDEF)-like protein
MRSFRLIPRTAHNQILLLGSLFIVLGGLVLGLGLTQLAEVRHHLDRAHGELAPAADHLATTGEAYGAGHALFVELVATPDPTEKATLLSKTTGLQARGDDAWRAFKANADALPNTQSLVDAVDYDLGVLKEEGAALLNAPTPELAASFDRTQARVSTELNTLLRRFSAANRRAILDAEADADTTYASVLTVYGVVLVIVVGTTAAAVILTRRRERRDAVREAERQAQMQRDELDTRLQRALEVSPTEETTFAVVEAAMRRSIPVIGADLLVAESHRGHLRRVATTLDEACEGTCGVASPEECPATSRGTTTVFGGHDALDSCPVRASQGLAPASTTCVPVNVSGHASGVVCAARTPGERVDDTDLATIELIARKMGERLTLTRAFARSETLARTDPLTGLYNRRTVEEKAAQLEREQRPYIVAYADLDHFKLVNDVYGHDAGDHALRLFARVLRDSIRPTDIPCRYGGEEFVVVLPDCPVTEGVAVLERIRTKLGGSFDGDGAPKFTVSFGLSQSDDGRTFDDVVAEADAALLGAKEAGRDRVVVSADH